LFFILNFVNVNVKWLLKNFLIFIERTQITYTNFKVKNFNLYTKYLNNQSFNADYIYYWDRKSLPLVPPSAYKTLSYSKITLIPNLNNINNITDSLFFTKFTLFYKNWLVEQFKRSFSFGFYYLRGLFFIFFIDACLTDDEPLWEPIEWSLIQTWILFIFTFAWIAENLIVSRYGSYAGRDKRVWMSWYKTFWLIEGYYMLNYGIVAIFVMVPFYFEINYNLSFVYSWWHWYSRVFFF
jgi:hypothetical protein